MEWPRPLLKRCRLNFMEYRKRQILSVSWDNENRKNRAHNKILVTYVTGTDVAAECASAVSHLTLYIHCILNYFSV